MVLAPLLPFSSSSDAEVAVLLKKHRIGLTVKEAQKICTMLGRDPTLTEATIWGVQGSEHCSYKSSRRFLKMLPTKGKHVILGPGEDSGIVAITDGPKGKRWGIVISHESHNHPSQIVPYEGAATGVGGVVRDVVCMGARVIGCLDMLRLGDLKTEESRTIAREVARGIAGYGNPLGIPNLGGDTVFDAGYNSSCLVNAAAVGIVREDEVIHSEVPEEAAKERYQIIVVGKPTDRSGFGGASFASAAMEEGEKEKNSGAVQEPNPFLERHLLASTYALFDWLCASGNLHRVSFKDHGAGGNVCSSVEQVAGRGYGADIDLGHVHVAIPDLPPEVIACAETQERLCWVVHPDLVDHVLEHYNVRWDLPSVAEGARASVIGTVTGDGIYRLHYRGNIVCEAKSSDLTSGLLYDRPVHPANPHHGEPSIACHGDRIVLQQNHATHVPHLEMRFSDMLRAMISHPNGCSRDAIIKHYDKTVIGNTVVEAGEADASVIRPLQDLASHVHEGTHTGWNELSQADRNVGVALAADGNGRYGRISAYWQGANAVVETMRNVAAVGALPRALTDCLNYGNPEIPEQLWSFGEGVRGIAEAATGTHVDGAPVPIISGNVSLYNCTPEGSSIDPTAVVCCIGVLQDARKSMTPQWKKSGSALLYIGTLRDECGGSLYHEILEERSGAPRNSVLGNRVPKPDFASVAREIAFLTKHIANGTIVSAHDVSEGGILLALFEMSTPQRGLGGTLGAEIRLDTFPATLQSDVILLSQSGGFIIEVDPRNLPQLMAEAQTMSIPSAAIGTVQSSPMLRVHRGTDLLLEEDLKELRIVWQKALYHRFL